MNKIGQFLDRLISRLSYGGAVMGVFGIIIMAVLITVSVVLRYFFRVGLPFTVEYSGYILVMVIFMGLAYTTLREAHVSVDFVIKRLSKKRRSILEITTTFLAMVMVVVFFWYDIDLFIKSKESGVTSLTKMLTPIWIPQIFLVLGMAIFCVATLTVVIRKVIDFRRRAQEGTEG